MISARALGIYYYLKSSGANISAESLARVFPEGRKTILTALKELRKEGLLLTTREVVNGKYVTVSRLTDGSPKSAPLLLQYEQNSNLYIDAYSVNIFKNIHGGAVEGEKMDDYSLGRYDIDEDDIRELKRKEQKRRQEEYAEMKSAEAEKKIEAKRNLTPADWSSDHCVYEFAERMSGMWHVQPWTTARTRFKGAFAKSRKIHGTTGDVELRMMDRFFSGLEHQKHINDPEIIWKMFIKNYGSILLDVQRSTVTEKESEDADLTAAKQWEKYFNV